MSMLTEYLDQVNRQRPGDEGCIHVYRYKHWHAYTDKNGTRKIDVFYCEKCLQHKSIDAGSYA